MKLQTDESKKKNVEDQESITQFAVRTLQVWLEQSDFVEDEKKPIEFTRNKNFPDFWLNLSTVNT